MEGRKPDSFVLLVLGSYVRTYVRVHVYVPWYKSTMDWYSKYSKYSGYSESSKYSK